ncbi:MAG: hypothetical protein M1358_17625 [Chloroflexi bacterium]|nr:hypothetical protein [Chloroflexota bacterium]
MSIRGVRLGEGDGVGNSGELERRDKEKEMGRRYQAVEEESRNVVARERPFLLTRQSEDRYGEGGDQHPPEGDLEGREGGSQSGQDGSRGEDETGDRGEQKP